MIRKIEKNLTIILVIAYLFFSIRSLPGTLRLKEDADTTFHLIPYVGVFMSFLTMYVIQEEIHGINLVNLIVDGQTKESIMKTLRRIINRLMIFATIILSIITSLYLLENQAYGIVGNNLIEERYTYDLGVVALQIVKIVILMFIMSRITYAWSLRNLVKSISLAKLFFVLLAFNIVKEFVSGVLIVDSGDKVLYILVMIVLITIDRVTYRKYINTFLRTDIA